MRVGCLIIALWCGTSSSLAASTPMHNAAAIASAKVEGEQHLAKLRDDGALGISRPVRVVGRRPDAAGAGAKIVHLVRHGQAYHNLLGDLYRELGREIDSTGGDTTGSPYVRPEVVDPPLTESGRIQARALRPTTARLAPELIVVSPMRRATETALLGFPDRATPFVAVETCHETAGLHTCDHRLSRSELAELFPHVDYALIAEEEDPYWNAAERETSAGVAARAYEFMLWLRTRPEREIAVVSHSSFLFTLLNAVVECEDGLAEWFMTGELRTVAISFEDADGHEPAKRPKVEL